MAKKRPSLAEVATSPSGTAAVFGLGGIGKSLSEGNEALKGMNPADVARLGPRKVKALLAGVRGVTMAGAGYLSAKAMRAVYAKALSDSSRRGKLSKHEKLQLSKAKVN